MDKEISEELLDRYINNNCTDAEKQFVETWYDSYEALPPLFLNEKDDEAKQWSKDSKNAIDAMIDTRQENKNFYFKQITIIQSWFLKASKC